MATTVDLEYAPRTYRPGQEPADPLDWIVDVTQTTTTISTWTTTEREIRAEESKSATKTSELGQAADDVAEAVDEAAARITATGVLIGTHATSEGTADVV
jgi:hypothetical protein